MKKRIFIVLAALALALGVSACGASKVNGKTLDERVAALENFQKTFPEGTQWWMLQMEDHLSRAWFDAQAGNWNLAAFDTGEMTGVDKSLINTRTKWKDQITAYEKKSLQPLIDSTGKKDLAAFTTAYDNEVAGCNACHAANKEDDHTFAMIKIVRPTTNPVGNQDFAGAK